MKNSEISPKYPEFSLFLKNRLTFLHGESWLGWGAVAPSGAMCIEQVTGLTHLLTQFAWAHGCLGFPGGSDGKASACHGGDPGSIPGSGRSPGEGNGNPLQYSCLKNPMDRGAWWATVHVVTKSRTRLSDFTFRPRTVIATT